MRNLISTILLSTSVWFSCSICSAQTVPVISIPDRFGTAVPRAPYADVKGNVYLFDDWSLGVVKLDNGDTYKDVPLRFNQVDGVVTFKKDNEELRFSIPITEFVINGAHFKRNFPEVDNKSKETYYQILSDGNIKLLKSEIKRIAEFKGYNENVEKKIVKSADYYLFINNKMHPVKLNTKSVEKVLNANGVDYKKSSNNIRTEDDLISFLRTILQLR